MTLLSGPPFTNVGGIGDARALPKFLILHMGFDSHLRHSYPLVRANHKLAKMQHLLHILHVKDHLVLEYEKPRFYLIIQNKSDSCYLEKSLWSY